MFPIAGAQWRNEVVSNEIWDKHINPAQPVQPGEAGGFLVRSGGGVVAYLKPTKDEPSCPRPAHEKICADLAFEIGLPVPPAVLYRRPNPGAEAKQVVLSLVPHGATYEWQHLFNFGDPTGGI